jgi:hypothetical protein
VFNVHSRVLQTFFNSRHIKNGAKIVKVHQQFLRRDFIVKKRAIRLLLKVLIILLFLFLNFFSTFLQTPAAQLPTLRGTPVENCWFTVIKSSTIGYRTNKYFNGELDFKYTLIRRRRGDRGKYRR